ncbi:MAG: tRNA (adenosine(37)-N6)-threonylcarbamoyltransferase complex ATPase subunit type 1 TsaE [Armatimonadota bacterium]
MFTICTDNAEETMAFGEALGSRLGSGDVIALYGDLGAGKTTMTKGIALGAGVDAEIHSPTFTLIHEHAGRVPFYHVDLYRLTGDEDIEFLGLEEYLYGDGIVVIEWADRAPKLLPAERIEINLGYTDDDRREIRIGATSERLNEIIELVVSNARACD